MNKTLLNLKNLGIPVAIVLIIILGLIFLLSQKNNTSKSESVETIPVTTTDAEAVLLPVDDQTQIKLADKVVTFNESYIVNAIVQAKKIDGIICGIEQNDSCIINLITDSTSIYYVATPFEPIYDVGLENEAIAKPIELSTGTTYLKYVVLESYNDAGEKLADQEYVSQIYGCITDRICVGSGLLNTNDLNTNRALVVKFEDFVKSLNIQ